MAEGLDQDIIPPTLGTKRLVRKMPKEGLYMLKHSIILAQVQIRSLFNQKYCSFQFDLVSSFTVQITRNLAYITFDVFLQKMWSFFLKLLMSAFKRSSVQISSESLNIINSSE